MEKTAAALSGAAGEKSDQATGLPVDDAPRKKGVQGIKGLGMDKEAAWEGQPGEDDRDPFSVPREVVRKRNVAMAVKLCSLGQLVQFGVPKENYEAARNWFDGIWAKSCADFGQLVKAFEASPELGRPAIINANRGSDYLAKNFKVPQGNDQAAGEWFDWVRARKLEREKQNAVRPEARPGDAGPDADPPG